MKRTLSRILALTLSLMLVCAAFAVPASAEEAKYVSDYASKQDAINAGAQLNLQIASEGMVLLKNEGNALPLADGAKISVFGYASVAPAGGGDAAGGDTSGGVVKLQSDIYSSLADAGFEVNPALKMVYDGMLSSGKVGNDSDADIVLDATRWSWEESLSGFNDAALVVLSADASTVTTMTGSVSASMGYADSQYALIDYVTEKFDRVIVLINSSKPREIAPLKANEKVQAILQVGEPGDNGFDALGLILKGQVNPSGRTSDTWAASFLNDPSYVNFNHTGDPNNGYGRYVVNGETTNSYFVEYEEGIYVGYRYYETRGYEEAKAGNEGWYDENVVYTFGHGLSYTTFDWAVEPATAADSAVTKDDVLSFNVTVTNTGDKAGKDVVELYYTAPYGEETTNETKIEKAYVVLGDYAKTKELAPGESETVTLTLKVSDMASYDYVTDKTYVLDDGAYNIKIARSAHDYAADFTYTVAEKALLNTSVTGYEVTNRLDDVTEGYLAMTDSRLSRADFAGTFPTAAPETIELTEEEYAAWNWTYGDKETDPWYVSEMPIQADAETRPEKAAVVLADLVGKDYDDPLWDELLNELTIQEMADLINNGGFKSINIDYIGKPYSLDTDGPKGWTGTGRDTSHEFNKFAAEPMIASTWSKELLYQMGVMIGDQGLWGNATQASGMAYNYTGWYAPGMNIHRSVYDSRYTEYYSEDPFLSGTCAAQASLGAKTKGCYVSIKHFAFHNDGGGVGISFTPEGRYLISGYRGGAELSSGLSAWFDEQAAREIYLKGYQIAVEEGQASYAMASFTRVGSTWCGGSYAVNTEILRNEWGFKGAVVTDIVIYGFLPADQMIRAGVDYLLNTGMTGAIGTSQGFTDYDATQVSAMRNATKHILYMVANSNAMQLPLGAKVVYDYPTYQDELGDTVKVKIPAGKAGEAYETPALNTASLNTYGPFAELTYAVSGLPEGLEFNAETGAISGTPAAAGEYTVTITAAAEGYGEASVDYTITIE
ncbi:MAG: glycoside hydrolase family 3 C-terminal domain-containing protein [Clostridia bacterium]|nr:glycoside hydrolase family 3 C-terminal domain-containing protein [Clostridia bacterium]